MEVAVMVSVKQGEGKELNTDVTYLSRGNDIKWPRNSAME